jgi:hypothetical protein
MKRLYSEERLHIQPAFIYAVLAFAKLLRSSKLETGTTGLSYAFDFVHQAHDAYKNAIDFHWLDTTLAEAAFVGFCRILFKLSEPFPDSGPVRNLCSPSTFSGTDKNLSR